jgi:hypothetical protein
MGLLQPSLKYKEKTLINDNSEGSVTYGLTLYFLPEGGAAVLDTIFLGMSTQRQSF